MSDNIRKLNRFKNSGKGRLVILTAVAVLVVLVLVLCLFSKQLRLDFLSRSVKYLAHRRDASYGTSSFDVHASNRYALLDDGLAVASVGGVETFSEKGTVRHRVTGVLTEPVLQEGRELLLCYDLGGGSLYLVHNGKGEVLKLASSGGFYDADISLGDTLATAASESGYKTVLRVYNERQEETYRWFSASSYMPLCAVSPTGKTLAAVSFGQSRGSFESSLNLFDTGSEEEPFTVSLGDELIYDLRFTAENTICLVGENSVAWYTADGVEKSRFHYDGRFLHDYDLSGDGFVLLALNMYRAGEAFTVLTVKEDGTVMGELDAGTDLQDISVSSGHVSVLTSQSVMLCRKNMTVCAEKENSRSAEAVLQRGDGTMLLISRGSAELYIP